MLAAGVTTVIVVGTFYIIDEVFDGDGPGGGGGGGDGGCGRGGCDDGEFANPDWQELTYTEKLD